MSSEVLTIPRIEVRRSQAWIARVCLRNVCKYLHFATLRDDTRIRKKGRGIFRVARWRPIFFSAAIRRETTDELTDNPICLRGTSARFFPAGFYCFYCLALCFFLWRQDTTRTHRAQRLLIMYARRAFVLLFKGEFWNLHVYC